MIEYLYDAIRAVAGQDINVGAMITDANEELITEDCYLVLCSDEDGELYKAQGIFQDFNGMWQFTIPASITTGLKGRYLYDIRYKDENLCFKQPIYLV